MTRSPQLPEKIRNDISIYLAPDEKILKSMTSSSGQSDNAGQVWIILTSNSILFHTCQTSKEPLIALLERKAIKEIEYFQRATEIVLTFVPGRNPKNTTRFSFAMDKRDELEDFCDDLADLINFKKETPAGIKSFSATATVPPAAFVQPAAKTAAGIRPIEEPQIRHAASAIKVSDKPESVPRPATVPTLDPAAAGRMPDVKIISQPGKPAATEKDTENSQNLKAGYIIVATLVSILVAFLWYQFFKSLSNTR